MLGPVEPALEGDHLVSRPNTQTPINAHAGKYPNTEKIRKQGQTQTPINNQTRKYPNAEKNTQTKTDTNTETYSNK
jgi:hypothetical protein